MELIKPTNRELQNGVLFIEVQPSRPGTNCQRYFIRKSDNTRWAEYDTNDENTEAFQI